MYFKYLRMDFVQIYGIIFMPIALFEYSNYIGTSNNA